MLNSCTQKLGTMCIMMSTVHKDIEVSSLLSGLRPSKPPHDLSTLFWD